MGKGAKGAVGGGVAVAANDGHAGKGEALLGPDNVDDALADVGHVEKFDVEILSVLGKGFNLDF